MSVREKLDKRASKVGLSLTDELSEGLAAYFELLRKWNVKVSLTSLPVDAASDEALDRLLIEPVIAAKHLPFTKPVMLDIGSGGGSPAIPMRLAVPGISLRMVESKTRKAAFLREVVRTLQLDRVTVDAVRFEELLVRPLLHDAADVITVRAVRIDRRTLAGLQSFLRPGGMLFLFGAGSQTRPDMISPTLKVAGAPTLLPQWGSRLQILQKMG